MVEEGACMFSIISESWAVLVHVVVLQFRLEYVFDNAAQLTEVIEDLASSKGGTSERCYSLNSKAVPLRPQRGPIFFSLAGAQRKERRFIQPEE